MSYRDNKKLMDALNRKCEMEENIVRNQTIKISAGILVATVLSGIGLYYTIGRRNTNIDSIISIDDDVIEPVINVYVDEQGREIDVEQIENNNYTVDIDKVVEGDVKVIREDRDVEIEE